jgi:hypothetical protein
MKQTVIIAHGPASGLFDMEGVYIKSYDPEAHNGGGDARYTHKLSEALKFKDFKEAYEFADRIPAARPLRADGKPNRPLRAFHLEFINVTV